MPFMQYSTTYMWSKTERGGGRGRGGQKDDNLEQDKTNEQENYKGKYTFL